MFLFDLIHTDPIANTSAANNRLRQEVYTQQVQDTFANTLNKPAPALSATTGLLAQIHNVFMPGITHHIGLVLNTLLRLNREGAASVTASEVQNLQTAITRLANHQLPGLTHILRIFPNSSVVMNDIEYKLTLRLKSQKTLTDSSTNPSGHSQSIVRA